jgi:hypothetical protein
MSFILFSPCFQAASLPPYKILIGTFGENLTIYFGKLRLTYRHKYLFNLIGFFADKKSRNYLRLVCKALSVLKIFG